MAASPYCFVARIAIERFCTWIPISDRAFQIPNEDGVERNIQKPRLPADGLLRVSARGEITRDFDKALEHPICIADGGDDHARPETRTIPAYSPAFVLRTPAESGYLLLSLRLAGFSGFWRIKPGEMLSDNFFA